MYATMFRVDLHAISSCWDRVEAGRSLAQSLSTLPGFVAFLALESGQREVVGLCICEDLAAVAEVHELASDWQRIHTDQSDGEIQLISAGRVIVQFGL